MTMLQPALDHYAIYEHGPADVITGPPQRLNRKLLADEVSLIRKLYEAATPPYRIWRTLFRQTCSYHTVMRAATRQTYQEQP